MSSSQKSSGGGGAAGGGGRGKGRGAGGGGSRGGTPRRGQGGGDGGKVSGRGGGGGGGRGGGGAGGGGGRGSGRGGGGGGRGGGGRPGSRNATPKHGRQGQQQQQGQQQPLKFSGERGAEAHTVSEELRIRLTQSLLQLRENDAPDARLEFSSDLTNTERKFLHQLAMQLGLKSKSSGKGDDRRITVTKVAEGKKSIAERGQGQQDGGGGGDAADAADADGRLPRLDVGPRGVRALEGHVARHPPTRVEEAESRLSGSSLFALAGAAAAAAGESSNGDAASHPSGEGGAALVDTLNELGLGSTPSPSLNADAGTFKPRRHHRNRRLGGAPPKIPSPKQRAEWHKQSQSRRARHPQYKSMLKQRMRLPAWNHSGEVCDAVLSNPVTIVSGDTGCGKSTQVPQFLLDDPRVGPSASIVVTQPRRISAITVAERVASERCEECGTSGSTVGYSVRMESATSPAQQLLFVTPGVLLRKLGSDRNLTEFTHVVIDEVHERDKYTEFLMIALRDVLRSRRPDLRIILMSATLQANELIEYWRGAGDVDVGGGVGRGGDLGGRPPEVAIPGRTFPVQEFFLEDILSATGYVDDVPGGAGGRELERLEGDLAALLDRQRQLEQQSSSSSGRGSGGGGGGRRGKNNAQQRLAADPAAAATASAATANTLSCVMCGKSGFRFPEELGAHVATCDGGGGGCTMEELEVKLREMDNDASDSSTLFAVGYDDVLAAAAEAEEEAKKVAAAVGDEDLVEDYDDGEEDEVPGVDVGMWDGQSPFEGLGQDHHSTLTEEELLRRYQASHDDEQIDDGLLLEVCRYIVESSYGDGAILIFFPGWMEISEMILVLDSTPPFNDRTKFSVLPLHSGVPSKDQRKVFARPPPGVRKIVCCTNIAETSVTIDDVAFVVDTGRAKEKSYDPHLKTSTLQPVWVSQASAKQRKGRAGRTKPGVCFRLFSRRRHSSFRPFLESELLRTPLEEMCLQCKQLDLAPGGPEDVDGIKAFLGKALTPPHPKSVSNALELLVELGAMESETNNLTDLGHCLSVFSLEPRVGKMVIWSHLLGCAGMGVAMGVAMSYKSPFALPPSSLRRKADLAKVQLSENSESDQITVLNALRARDDIVKRRGIGSLHSFCSSNFLSISTLQMIAELRKNTSRELTSLGFPPSTVSGYHNRHGGSDAAFLQAAIAAGLYPNVASRRRGDVNFSTMTNRKAKVHVSSVNSCRGQPLNERCRVDEGGVEFIIFGEMVRGVTFFTMSQTSHLSSPLPLLLLCGELRVRPSSDTVSDEADTSTTAPTSKCTTSVLSVDGWIVFQCEARIAANLVVLRRRLDNAFLHLVANPPEGLDSLVPAEKDAVETLSVVLKSAHHAMAHR